MAAKRTTQGSANSVFDAITFGLDCQEVILRRLPRLARGDAAAMREAQRMITEKATTATLAAWRGMFAWSVGGETAAVEAVAGTYRSAVRSNKRRLRR